MRGGIFDRVEIVQHDAGFRFRDRDHQRLADIAAEGAPALREVALFVVPQDAPFDPVAPWRLQLMVQRVLSVSDKAFVTFDLDYALPDVYTRAAPASAGAAAGPATATPASQGPSSAGAAQADAPADEAPPELWRQIWNGKPLQIAILTAALAVLAGIFFFQDQPAGRCCTTACGWPSCCSPCSGSAGTARPSCRW